MLDTIEKQSIINLSSNSSKSYTSVVLSDSEITFLEKGKMQPFDHFYILSCLLTVFHNSRRMSSNFLDLRRNFVEACSFSALNFSAFR